MDGSLAARTEVSWGAGLLELNRYAEYTRAIASNPRLLHGLSVNYLVDPLGRLEVNPSALPRVSVPPKVFGSIASGGYAELASLDPAQGSVVEGSTQNLDQQQPSELTVTGYREDFYRIRYSAAADTLIRIAVPYAPGWAANVDGAPVAVRPVDYASERRAGPGRPASTNAAIPTEILPAWRCAEYRSQPLEWSCCSV